jgi:hypothetical protein
MSRIYRKSLIACCTPPLSSDRPYQAACSRHGNRCRLTAPLKQCLPPLENKGFLGVNLETADLFSTPRGGVTLNASVFSSRSIKRLKAKTVEFRKSQQRAWQTPLAIVGVGALLCIVTMPIFGTHFNRPTGCTSFFCSKQETSFSYIIPIIAVLISTMYLAFRWFSLGPTNARAVKFQCQGCSNSISITGA